MELELKNIQERPLILFILIAVVIHVAIGYVAFLQLQTPTGVDFVAGIVKPNPPATEPEKPSNPVVNPADITAENKNGDNEDSDSTIPPFEQSSLLSDRIHNGTFVHESSGFLFADEILVPDNTKPEKAERVIIPPKIHREFTLRNLHRDFRSREWNLTLRVKVSKEGDPIGQVRLIKSSGDKTLDTITITRVSESRFEPAYYMDNSEYLDYTFDLEINYK